jgi:hypothetical protein
MAVYQDLLKDSSTSLDNNNYFNLTITDLNMNETYPLQFRWKYSDGTFSSWGATKIITTPGPTIPPEADLPVGNVVGGAGFIKVIWNGNSLGGAAATNVDRVDIHIAGQSFGDGTKPAGLFKVAGNQTFVAEPGSYIVQLKTYTLNATSAFFSVSRTVTVTAVGEAIQTPALPTGLTAVSAPFSVSINWSGAYSVSTFTGFKSIDIYAVSSDLGATATSGITDTNLVGSLTVNDTPNKINIGLDNLRQALSLGSNAAAYTATIFFYYVAVNKNNVKYGSPTYTRINSSSVVPTQANYVDLASGVISIENLVAGNGQFGSWLRTGTAGGARIELSAVNNFTDNGYTVKKGLTAYSSGSTQTLGFDLSSGALSLSGSLAATSISTSSGKFAVDSGGVLTATDVTLTGIINASSGNIGGLTLFGDSIQNASQTFKLDGIGTGNTPGRARFGSATGNAIIIEPSGNIFHTNNGTSASGKFTVSGGVLTVSGTINASDIYGSTIVSSAAGTGQRIELRSSTNALSFFNSAGLAAAHVVSGDDANNPGVIIHTGATSLVNTTPSYESSFPRIYITKNISGGTESIYLHLTPVISGTVQRGIEMFNTGSYSNIKIVGPVDVGSTGFIPQLRNIDTISTTEVTNYGLPGTADNGSIILTYTP